MKKAYKIILIVAAALVIIGAGVMGGTFAASGFDWGKFIVDKEDMKETVADVDGAGVTSLVFAKNYDHYDVTLIPSPDENFHITYYTLKSEEIQYNVSNDTLTISSTTGDWKDYIGFFNYSGIDVTVAVPATVETLDARLGAMSLTCSDLNFKGSVALYADAGEVMMKNVTADQMSIQADMADVNLSSVTAKQLTASVESGSANFDRVTADNLSVDADYGDIDFSFLSIAKEAIFSTDCGSINGTIDDSQSAFTITSETDMGECNLPNNAPGGDKKLHADADAGEIYITFLR